MQSYPAKRLSVSWPELWPSALGWNESGGTALQWNRSSWLDIRHEPKAALGVNSSYPSTCSMLRVRSCLDGQKSHGGCLTTGAPHAQLDQFPSLSTTASHRQRCAMLGAHLLGSMEPYPGLEPVRPILAFAWGCFPDFGNDKKHEAPAVTMQFRGTRFPF